MGSLVFLLSYICGKRRITVIIWMICANCPSKFVNNRLVYFIFFCNLHWLVGWTKYQIILHFLWTLNEYFHSVLIGVLQYGKWKDQSSARTISTSSFPKILYKNPNKIYFLYLFALFMVWLRQQWCWWSRMWRQSENDGGKGNLVEEEESWRMNGGWGGMNVGVGVWFAF